MHKLHLVVIGFFVIAGQGCKWVDDFREREQPQYLERPARATLNPDAIDYKGDDTHMEEDLDYCTPMPYIDEISPIPEVPDHPAGF